MKKFSRFSDWESQKYQANEESEPQKSSVDSNAKLLAEIADLEVERKSCIKNARDFEARILEIDIKLLRMEVDKNNMLVAREQLLAASQIAKGTRKEGRNYEQD
jgi:hypothetical protein